jgi:hypothetical protein
MLRGFKRVRNRVAVLPTMAAYPAPEASRHAEPARSAREDAAKSRGRTSRSSTSDGFGPTPAWATDKLATAPPPKGDKPAVPASNKPAALAPPLDDLDDTRPARWGLPQVALIAAFLVVSAAGWSLYRGDLANDFGLTIPPATQAGDDLAQVRQALQLERDKSEKLAHELRSQAATAANNSAHGQELNELQRALQQEHDKAEQLARELAAAWRALRSQATAMADNAAQDQQLSDLQQALQQVEASAAAYREMLAQERARNQDLQQQLAARGDVSPGRRSNAGASLSETPGRTLVPTTDKQLALLPANDKSMIPAENTPATMAARPAVAEVPGIPEAPRLMARASLLLSQGNVGAARIVLERAAETGSAPALFALAETHDPTTLAAWGTFGTQGDVAKARELYAKALAGGVLEARDRLNALR